jgi:hypothetical protein
MRRASIVLALLLLLASARSASAQDLQPVLERIAAAWHKGDAGAIAGLASRNGVSIDIGGASVGPLPQRQVAPVLRRAFDERESVSARVNMARQGAGEAGRAYGEIAWSIRARGTTIPERLNLYVGLILEDGAWRISEVRLLR